MFRQTIADRLFAGTLPLGTRHYGALLRVSSVARRISGYHRTNNLSAIVCVMAPAASAGYVVADIWDLLMQQQVQELLASESGYTLEQMAGKLDASVREIIANLPAEMASLAGSETV